MTPTVVKKRARNTAMAPTPALATGTYELYVTGVNSDPK